MMSAFQFIRSVLGGLFIAFFVFPVTSSALIIGFASGWSFTEVGRWIVSEQATSQQLGKAADLNSLIVKRCAVDGSKVPSEEHIGKVADCKEWSVESVSIQEAAFATGQTLFSIYTVMAFVGLCLTVAFYAGPIAVAVARLRGAKQNMAA